MRRAVFLIALLLPQAVLAQGDASVELSKPAVVDGRTIPLQATISATSSDIELSATKKEGSVPVTLTVYVTPKPKPAPAATSSGQAAATVESSQGIQQAIGGVSPAVAGAVAPFFQMVDGGRQALADVVETQMATTKKSLPGGNPGSVLGSETVQNAPKDPMGTFVLMLKTLYFYLLTLLGFIIASAGVFYPALAILILYLLWKIVRRIRRPA